MTEHQLTDDDRSPSGLDEPVEDIEIDAEEDLDGFDDGTVDDMTEPYDVEPVEPDQPSGRNSRQRNRRRRRMTKKDIRRTIGLMLILAIAFGLYYLIFVSDVLQPLMIYAAPVESFLGWVKEDPSRLMMSAAAFIIPHLGLYFALFGDD